MSLTARGHHSRDISDAFVVVASVYCPPPQSPTDSFITLYANIVPRNIPFLTFRINTNNNVYYSTFFTLTILLVPRGRYFCVSLSSQFAHSHSLYPFSKHRIYNVCMKRRTIIIIMLILPRAQHFHCNTNNDAAITMQKENSYFQT